LIDAASCPLLCLSSLFLRFDVQPVYVSCLSILGYIRSAWFVIYGLVIEVYTFGGLCPAKPKVDLVKVMGEALLR
jgi:hypothetical protein